MPRDTDGPQKYTNAVVFYPDGTLKAVNIKTFIQISSEIAKVDPCLSVEMSCLGSHQIDPLFLSRDEEYLMIVTETLERLLGLPIDLAYKEDPIRTTLKLSKAQLFVHEEGVYRRLDPNPWFSGALVGVVVLLSVDVDSLPFD